MNEIDKLIIKIEADTKQLKAELNKIEGKIKVTGAAGGAAFGMAGGGLGAKLKGIKGPAVAAAASIVAIGVAITKIAKVGMEFEDLTDSLNTVFGSMEAGEEAMGRVLAFAQTTPFQIETATKAFISLKSAGIEPSNRMLQVFADTASTSTDQLGVFEALVKTVQRSASGGLGLEELNMVMDRGIDVLGILNDELGLSKDEIAKFGASAEGAAIIVEALTTGLERKFGGAMEDKMDNLSTKASNMTIAFKQLADALFQSGIADVLKSMADSMTEFANGITLAIRSSQGKGLGIVLGDDPFENAMLLEEKRRALQAEVSGEGIREGTTKMQQHKLMAERGAFDDEKKLIANITKELDKQYEAQDRLLDGYGKLSEAEKGSIFEKGQLLNQYTFLENEISKLAGDTEMLADTQANLGKIFSENEAKFALMGITTLPQLEEKFKEIEQASSDVAESFSESLAPAIQSMSLSFTKDFVDSLLEGQNALSGFQDFAKNIVSAIIATFLQLAVVNTILNSIFGKGTFDQYNWGTGKIDKASAGGGSAHGGQPMIVGERGPELFVPHSSGNIMNGMNTKNAMGGGGTTIINQSINFATGVVPTVRAEVMKMMPQIAEVTKGAVAEAAMRGGNFRRALAGG
jgi:hypothetical protein